MSSVVALPPHGPHVHINNAYRNENESAYQFSVPPLAFGLITGVGSYLLQLKQVTIQHLVKNIRRGISDTFTVNYNGSQTIFVLQPNNYDIDSLVTAMNTSLATLNAGLVLSYDYTAMVLTLAIPNGVTFGWVSNSAASTIGKFNYPNATDRFLAMIGFDRQKNTTFTGPTAITASNNVNLLATSCLNINFQQNLNVITAGGSSNPQILASVPITGSFGDLLVYEPSEPRTFQLNPIVLETLNIDVTDDYGNRIDVPDSARFTLSFTLITNSTTYE